MITDKSIWRVVAAAAVVALVLAGLRFSRVREDGPASPQSPAALQDREIETMLRLLLRDPRIRRAETQRQVETVAHFAKIAASPAPETFYALGLLRYYGENNFSEAEKAFRNAIARDPNWSWAHNGLAILLFDSGKEAEADAAWAEAIRLDPQWSRPYSDRAILYRRAGRVEEAIREIEKALVLDPDGAITHYNYAVLLDVQGQHTAARERYLKVVGLDPGLPAPHYNLACGYAREGDLDKALPYLETAISLNEAFRNEAQTDPDFDKVRTEDAFRQVLEQAMP